MSDKFIKVEPVYNADGTVNYFNNGVVIALRLKAGTVADLRQAPPYLTMSPCPYCDAMNDRNHDLLKHIDPFCGDKVF